MKNLLLFSLLILVSADGAFAQGVRFDSQISQEFTTTAITGLTNVLTVPSGATVSFCSFPANAVPCTNKATTYTTSTLGTACNTSTQIVLVGTTSCVANPDSQGNWGVWVSVGTYAYTITLPGGVNLGPYNISAGCQAGVTCVALNANNAFTGNNTAPNWTVANAGVFTNTQMNEYVQSLLNGCSPTTEFNAGQGNTNFSTDALTGCVVIPSGSTVHNSNAVVGYVNNLNAGTTAGVAGYFQTRAGVNGAHNWGINPTATDFGFSSVFLTNEFDLGVTQPTTTGADIIIAGSFGAQPTNLPAINIAKPAQINACTTCAWTVGVNVGTGATTGVAIGIGPLASGNSQSSQTINLSGTNAGGTTETASISANLNGALVLTPVAGQVVSAQGPLAVGGIIENTAATATMGLTLKKGSGGGNYTTASTTYIVADSTNLCFTVTIPTGWKLGIQASGSIGTSTAIVAASAALTDNAACLTANAGILAETQVDAGAIGGTAGFSLSWVIAGDGNSHSVALQIKTANGADSALLLNSSSTALPTMVFQLEPSN